MAWLGTEPTPPPPDVIERLRSYLGAIIASGSHGERKAAIEALVAEVRITEEGVIPVFRIPGPHTHIPETADSGGADETTPTGEPVHALVRSVGRTYQHTNREVLIEGDPMTVRLRRRD